ncbi:Uncharacterized protein dnm_081720 [Desulfonema magnum]|uniref:Uncharacterized protein n=1 Tax=Desulfonema magnum TaxID=45655 RepID=A0A975GSN6_9BACT|nr:Uncharacterized protein dnm_081720 [Desulfonema magnum]
MKLIPIIPSAERTIIFARTLDNLNIKNSSAATKQHIQIQKECENHFSPASPEEWYVKNNFHTPVV